MTNGFITVRWPRLKQDIDEGEKNKEIETVKFHTETTCTTRAANTPREFARTNTPKHTSV